MSSATGPRHFQLTPSLSSRWKLRQLRVFVRHLSRRWSRVSSCHEEVCDNIVMIIILWYIILYFDIILYIIIAYTVCICIHIYIESNICVYTIIYSILHVIYAYIYYIYNIVCVQCGYKATCKNLQERWCKVSQVFCSDTTTCALFLQPKVNFGQGMLVQPQIDDRSRWIADVRIQWHSCTLLAGCGACGVDV